LIQQHATVRFEANAFVPGTARATVLRFDLGRLAGQPLVDGFGYQYVTMTPTARFRSRRVPTLIHPGIVIDLNACF
jgi:hypothetical protein